MLRIWKLECLIALLVVLIGVWQRRDLMTAGAALAAAPSVYLGVRMKAVTWYDRVLYVAGSATLGLLGYALVASVLSLVAMRLGFKLG